MSSRPSDELPKKDRPQAIYVRQMPDEPLSRDNNQNYALSVTFLACPRKVTQRRAPGGPSGPFCSVALGTFRKLALRTGETLRARTVRNASPSDSVADRERPHGEAWKSNCISQYPHVPGSGPMKFLGTRLGRRERPAGRTRTVRGRPVSTPSGRPSCAGERARP